jgi:hypothetical protein
MSTEGKNTRSKAPYRNPARYPLIDGVRHFVGVTKEFLQELQRLPLEGNEVFLATFPKAGSKSMPYT